MFQMELRLINKSLNFKTHQNLYTLYYISLSLFWMNGRQVLDPPPNLIWVVSLAIVCTPSFLARMDSSSLARALLLSQLHHLKFMKTVLQIELICLKLNQRQIKDRILMKYLIFLSDEAILDALLEQQQQPCSRRLTRLQDTSQDLSVQYKDICL